MSTIRWASSLVAAGLLVGCAEKKVPAPLPPPIPTLSLDEARTQFKATNALAQVGDVHSTVTLDDKLIAAGDFPEHALSIDEPVTILAPVAGFPEVASGTVHNFVNEYVIIHLDNIKDAARPPKFGDLVVRIPVKPYAPGNRPGEVAPAAAPAPETQVPIPTPTPAPEAPVVPPAVAPPATAPETAPATPTPSPTPAPEAPATAPAAPATTPEAPATPPATAPAAVPETTAVPPATAPATPAPETPAAPPAPTPAPEVPAPAPAPTPAPEVPAPSPAPAPPAADAPAPPPPPAADAPKAPDLNK